MALDPFAGITSAPVDAPVAAPIQETKQETPKQEETKSAAPAPVSPAVEEKVQEIEEKVASGEKLTKKEEKTLKEYKLKINGREEVIKFDPFNDDEVVKHLQKARSSDEKFKEAADVRKAAMEFIEQLRKNPKRVLADPSIGIDVKKFAEEILNEEIQEMEKSPEQREREKLQKELDALRQQHKENEERLQKENFERMQQEQELRLESDITSALDVGGIPKTPRTVKAMAEMMMIALENGIDLSARDIAPIVKNTTLSEFKEVVTSLTDDQLEEFLGKEVIGRLRKKNVAKAKALDTVKAIPPTGNAPKQESKEPAKKQSYRSFFGV